MLFKVQLSSEYVLKQKLSPNMSKSTLFLIKKLPIAGGSDPIVLCLRPQTPTFVLFRDQFFVTLLIITALSNYLKKMVI